MAVGIGNIDLDEVLDEIDGDIDHTGNTLQYCIDYANTNGIWDNTYSGSKNSLLNFRGYSKFTNSLILVAPFAVADGLCGQPKTAHYFDSSDFDLATILYQNENSPILFSGQIVVSDGTGTRFWNGSTLFIKNPCF